VTRDRLLVDLGAVIASRRHDQGLRQQDVADQCGFDRAYLSTIEWGRRNPTLSTLACIADALGCKPSDLLAAAGY
jgi:transcriptional regulator with XRE-family HTH domain